MGIAREIAVINHLKLKKLKISSVTPKINNTISIFMKVPEKVCPQFLVRAIKNININVTTPLWITEKLRRCGVCSTNIVIDITNYVLLELGYPINIIDSKKIHGNMIYIRFSKIGETLVLTNNIVQLLPNTVILSDDTQPLSIAGTMISNQNYICSKTSDIILQSAFFNPSIIAKQCKLYRMHDLSSFRYARGGIDPGMSKLALERVTSLLLKNCGGCPGPIINIINNDVFPKPTSIVLNRSKLDKILGFHISDQKITRILKDIGFQIKFVDNHWNVLTPSWRFDITIEENLIAEIIRIYGYENIPNIPIHAKLTKNNLYKSNISISRAKTLLIDRGYQEIITYSFVNPDIQKLLHPQKIPLILKNPITLDMSVMRLSLWSGLIQTMIYNQNRQEKQIKLFESGICFIPNKTSDNQIQQNFMIAGIRSGLRFNTHWDLSKYLVDFYDIKGDVETLLNITNKLNYISFKKYIHPALHSGQSAAIFLKDVCVGYIGMIHPNIQTKLNLHSQALVFELSWYKISQCTLYKKITTISKFPKNCRDISVIVPENTSAESVITECKNIANTDQLIDAKLSDIYKGQGIEKGFKSFTIKLFLQSKTHTLKEEEITNIINQCSIILKKRFQGLLR